MVCLHSCRLCSNFWPWFTLNNLSDIYNDDDAGSPDANIELTAFWAPFLLLHLGGPDTITAYALEDNELWLRHLLGLVVQTGVAFCVFLMAWNGSYLSILFILMFLAGLVKCGERTWVLMSLSNDELGVFDSGFSLRNANFINEKEIKEKEGYIVEVERITEMGHRVDIFVFDGNSISDEDKLVIAYILLDLTKSFLLDSVVSSGDNAKTIFRNMSSKNAFEVIEIQLGMAYDFLYTKAPLLHTRWGLGLRLITFILTCSVFVLFSFLDHKRRYSSVDISITFLLLIVAIILEIYAAIVLLSSDRFIVWFRTHNKNTSTFNPLLCFPVFCKCPRWSQNMYQYSFLSSSMNSKPLHCHFILKPLTIIDKDLEKRRYISYKEVPENLKDLIFCHLRSRAGGYYRAPYTIIIIINPLLI